MFGHLYSRASLESGLSDQDLKLKQRVEPRWSGTVAYRALITKEQLEGLRNSEGKKGGRNYLELRMPVSVRYFSVSLLRLKCAKGLMFGVRE